MTATKQVQRNAHDDLLAALKGWQDWYASLPEPGAVPRSTKLRSAQHLTSAAISKAEA